MHPTLVLALMITMAAMLVVVSVAAGALWWRARSVPMLRALQLARDLAERQRRLEELIEKLEKAGKQRPVPSGPAGSTAIRLDHAHPSAVPGPTLISVPDLGAPPCPPAEAASELEKRFGPIWELAERGEPAEAIARITGQPIGQVDLVLGLRRQLETTTIERRK